MSTLQIPNNIGSQLFCQTKLQKIGNVENLHTSPICMSYASNYRQYKTFICFGRPITSYIHKK